MRIARRAGARHSARMTARRHARVVMLVGGDDDVARACARASSPLPLVRSSHVSVAADRLRELRPLAVYVASDVADGAVDVIGNLAAEQETPCINLAVEAPEVVRDRLRR
jgi:hypothetical protein